MWPQKSSLWYFHCLMTCRKAVPIKHAQHVLAVQEASRDLISGEAELAGCTGAGVAALRRRYALPAAAHQLWYVFSALIMSHRIRCTVTLHCVTVAFSHASAQ